jgi:hypothetical protein
MIYITQLIYIIEGQESIFNQFEEIAIPTIQDIMAGFYFESDQAKKIS